MVLTACRPVFFLPRRRTGVFLNIREDREIRLRLPRRIIERNLGFIDGYSTINTSILIRGEFKAMNDSAVIGKS
jgi:hypothetical protein